MPNIADEEAIREIGSRLNHSPDASNLVIRTIVSGVCRERGTAPSTVLVKISTRLNNPKETTRLNYPEACRRALRAFWSETGRVWTLFPDTKPRPKKRGSFLSRFPGSNWEPSRYEWDTLLHPPKFCPIVWSQSPGLNRGPMRYECIALPTELLWLTGTIYTFFTEIKRKNRQ